MAIREKCVLVGFLLGLGAVAPVGRAVAQDLDLATLSDADLLDELRAMEEALAAAEQARATLSPEPRGRFGAYLGYDSEFGAVGGVDVRLGRFLQDGQSLRAHAELGQRRERARVTLRNEAWFDAAPVLEMSLGYHALTHGQGFDFDSSRHDVSLGALWDVDAHSTLGLHLGYSGEDIRHVAAGVSSLIARDEGARERASFGVSYRLRFGEVAGWQGQAGVTLEASEVSKGEDSRKIELSADLARPLGAGWRWTAGLRAGLLRQSGDRTHVGDRFFLGNATLRGFEFGGFGPRDLGVAAQSSLGGDRYAALRFDLTKAAAFGLPETVALGVFADLGQLWGGVSGAGIDEGRDLRASIGVSAGVEMGAGRLVLELAHPVAQQDWDRTQVLNIGFSAKF